MSKNGWYRLGTAALLVSLLAFTCGCGIFSSVAVGEADAYEEENANLVVVGFSQVGSESVWRTTNTVSVQEALTKENGYFLIFSNARQKQENQIKALRSFISQRVDYIVFSPVTESGWDTVLEEAREAGIPVILLDRMVNVEDASLYTTWIGSDVEEEGRKAGRWLEQYLKITNRQKEEINIVVLQGTLGSTPQRGRSSGFMEIANKYINWHILDQRSGEFTTAKGKEVMEQILERYEDIDVVVSQNDDMTFGAIEAIEESGRSVGRGGDILILSFDAVRDALRLVEEGKIAVDVECNPEQGEYLAEVIGMLERGEKVEKAYVVEEKVFTKENVSGYMNSRTY